MPKVTPDELDAYDLLLTARQYSVTGNYGTIRRCEATIRLCRAAPPVDPEYATAWALMAAWTIWGQPLLRG